MELSLLSCVYFSNKTDGGLNIVRVFKVNRKSAQHSQQKFADGPKVSEALSGLSPFWGKINFKMIRTNELESFEK